MRGGHTKSVNLRLTPDTFDAFKSAADVLGLSTTALIRQFVDGSVPAVRAIQQSVAEVQGGRVSTGVGLYAALVESTVKQGELGRLQVAAMHAQALRDEGIE